jgi:hypothetical protein
MQMIWRTYVMVKGMSMPTGYRIDLTDFEATKLYKSLKIARSVWEAQLKLPTEMFGDHVDSNLKAIDELIAKIKAVFDE